MRAYLRPREACFLFSAQRFFIISDRRFRPSGVSRLARLAGEAVVLAAGDDMRGAGGKSVSSKAAMARFSRSRSRASSFTIAWISKGSSWVNSFDVST